MSQLFVFRSRMPASAERVYRFHALPDALERLQPPWESARVVSRTGGIEQPGSRVTLAVRVGPFSMTWIAEHTACEPGKMFRDSMVSGPFPRWEHTHLFLPVDEKSSELEDRVEYDLPLGWLGALFAGWYIRRRLNRMFAWRHRVTAEAVAAIE
ncbi:MAG TPA: SRPBCC family protein [Candidatus Acidoferrum sp.]|nr:SRPBCC family protein [Candidatus Acidoferrum sp.]